MQIELVKHPKTVGKQPTKIKEFRHGYPTTNCSYSDHSDRPHPYRYYLGVIMSIFVSLLVILVLAGMVYAAMKIANKIKF